MKSFNQLANPNKPPAYKRRRAPTKNPKPRKITPQNTEKCCIVPLLVKLYPELVMHNIKIKPLNPMFSYKQILLEAGNLRKELLKLI